MYEIMAVQGEINLWDHVLECTECIGYSIRWDYSHERI